eukprot:scaffold109322_cov30-Tisochrysis_lutea.AAC.2
MTRSALARSALDGTQPASRYKRVVRRGAHLPHEASLDERPRPSRRRVQPGPLARRVQAASAPPVWCAPRRFQQHCRPRRGEIPPVPPLRRQAAGWHWTFEEWVLCEMRSHALGTVARPGAEVRPTHPPRGFGSIYTEGRPARAELIAGAEAQGVAPLLSPLLDQPHPRRHATARASKGAAHLIGVGQVAELAGNGIVWLLTWVPSLHLARTHHAQPWLLERKRLPVQGRGRGRAAVRGCEAPVGVSRRRVPGPPRTIARQTACRRSASPQNGENRRHRSMPGRRRARGARGGGPRSWRVRASHDGPARAQATSPASR